jgi:hypothetical protein
LRSAHLGARAAGNGKGSDMRTPRKTRPDDQDFKAVADEYGLASEGDEVGAADRYRLAQARKLIRLHGQPEPPIPRDLLKRFTKTVRLKPRAR